MELRADRLPVVRSMNKASWLTVLLDGTAPLGEVTGLLDLSYSLTGPKLRRRPPAAPL